MREPSAGRTYATPDDLPMSLVMPDLLHDVKSGRVVYLSENGVPVAAVVPLGGAEAGLAALQGSAQGVQPDGRE